MKSLIIKIGSSLFFAIILTVVSAQAQPNKRYLAQIPFDFTVGKTVYPAGEYTIHIDNLYSLPLLKLENNETRKWKRIRSFPNGNRSETNKTFLVFNRYGSSLVLSQMISPDFGLTAPRVKASKMVVGKHSKPDLTIAVVLSNGGKNAE